MTDHNDIDDLPEAPRGLVDGLRAAHVGAPRVPVDVDRAVMAAARERLRPRRRRTVVLRWAGAMAAAVVLVVVGVAVTRDAGPEPAPAAAAERLVAVREDLDGSGRVDILDAFWLARRIETSDAPSDTWDIDGDGAVGQGDVDLIAMAAVRVNGGTIR